MIFPHKEFARILQDAEVLRCAIAFEGLKRNLFATLDNAERGVCHSGEERVDIECMEVWRLPESRTESHPGYLTAKFRVGWYVVHLGFPLDEMGVLVGLELDSSGNQGTPISIADVTCIGFSWAAKNPLFWRSLALLREAGIAPQRQTGAKP
jgi:hypothetical protein